MIVGITILLLFQLIGEILAYLVHGLVPGPVIGMALIFLVLSLLRGGVLAGPVQATIVTSQGLLANLGILFVPAGVGIVQHLHLLAERGLALIAIVVVSTIVTLVVTVWCYLFTKRLMGGPVHD